MLYDPDRHEALIESKWDEDLARDVIRRIVRDTETRFSEATYWPLHPLDRLNEGDARAYETSLYDGACGVFWALRYIHALGAVQVTEPDRGSLAELLTRNQKALGDTAERDRSSYLLGETPIHMLAFARRPGNELETILHQLIAGNIDHPARELMLGAPGTMLAALFLYEKTGSAQWAKLFRLTADRLWSQLEWSTEYECAYWTQDFDQRPSNYLDAVHGFVATVIPLSKGRHLLPSEKWAAWQERILNTVLRTSDREGDQVNWRPQLDRSQGASKKLMQFCHGAPGFVICLIDLMGINADGDSLLLAAGDTIWAAGPLKKGSNLCHGTAGNGYAFLKLYCQTRETLWLDRARAFAMHAIDQTEKEARLQGQYRYSLWTGDLGLAIFLWDCIVGKARFPTLDVF